MRSRRDVGVDRDRTGHCCQPAAWPVRRIEALPHGHVVGGLRERPPRRRWLGNRVEQGPLYHHRVGAQAIDEQARGVDSRLPQSVPRVGAHRSVEAETQGVVMDREPDPAVRGERLDPSDPVRGPDGDVAVGALGGAFRPGNRLESRDLNDPIAVPTRERILVRARDIGHRVLTDALVERLPLQLHDQDHHRPDDQGGTQEPPMPDTDVHRCGRRGEYDRCAGRMPCEIIGDIGPREVCADHNDSDARRGAHRAAIGHQTTSEDH